MLAVSLPNGELQGSWRNRMVTKTKPAILAQLKHLPRQHIGGIAPYEQERKRSSAMAYKNERDRICHSKIAASQSAIMVGCSAFEAIVLPPEPCGNARNVAKGQEPTSHRLPASIQTAS